MAYSSPVAVITGAGSGIGRALAIQLADRGYRLALADLNVTGLKETAALLRWAGGDPQRLLQLPSAAHSSSSSAVVAPADDAASSSASAKAIKTVRGSCDCGCVAVAIELTQPLDSYAPRRCDCTFCTKHGIAWLSDSTGSVRINVAEASKLQKYKQPSSSAQAEFLLCSGCGVVVAATFTDANEERTYAAVNASVLDGADKFAPATDVSVKQLKAQEKAARWRQMWFPAVDITVGSSSAVTVVDPFAELQSSRLFLRRLDVSVCAAVYSFAADVEAHFKQAPSLVINNAGVALSQTVEKLTLSDIEWLMGINFNGVLYGTKAFLPRMLKQQQQWREQAKQQRGPLPIESVIVNVSSVFGLLGVPSQGAYNASKFAVRGLTEALQHELSATPDCGVWACCVCPGGIKTNIARSARFYVDPHGASDAKAAHERFDAIASTTPDKAAETILYGIDTRQQRVLIGRDAHALNMLVRLLPTRYWSVLNALHHTAEYIRQSRVFAWLAPFIAKRRKQE